MWRLDLSAGTENTDTVKLGLGQGKWHKTTGGATDVKTAFHLDQDYSVGPHISD